MAEYPMTFSVGGLDRGQAGTMTGAFAPRVAEAVGN